jgi:Domain of unknown function (DUF4190)
MPRPDDDPDDRVQPRPPRGERRDPPPPRRPRPSRRYDDEEDDDQIDEPVSTIIPYRNGYALAAYYCGVFGLVPVAGNVLGPIALVLGVLGLRYVKNHPTAKGTAHAIVGIVLGVLETLVYCGGAAFAVVAILLASKH